MTCLTLVECRQRLRDFDWSSIVQEFNAIIINIYKFSLTVTVLLAIDRISKIAAIKLSNKTVLCYLSIKENHKKYIEITQIVKILLRYWHLAVELSKLRDHLPFLRSMEESKFCSLLSESALRICQVAERVKNRTVALAATTIDLVITGTVQIQNSLSVMFTGSS